MSESTKPSDQPRVTVAVVTVGRVECLIDTLQDLVRQDYPAYRIIVVDQNPGPVPALLDLARRHEGLVRVKHLRPPHICVARNVAILAEESDIVVFVDDDIRCSPDFVSQHVACYSDPKVGGVGGWIDAEAPVRVWKPEGAFVSGATGCNMSYRRSALLRAGGFDPHFKAVPAVGEERELTDRVRRLGLSIAVAPRALVYHRVDPEGGCRVREDPEEFWASTASCQVMLSLKTRPWTSGLLLLPWLLRLWWRLRRLSDGTLGARAYWQGVREGFSLARQSLRQPEYLSLTPALPWLD